MNFVQLSFLFFLNSYSGDYINQGVRSQVVTYPISSVSRDRSLIPSPVLGDGLTLVCA